MMNKCITVALLATLITISFTSCKPTSSSEHKTTRLPEATNVLLITLDTTRADRLGCYGYDLATTPTLDMLAHRGILFEKAYTQVPLTLPSHASILTGRYPREHGIRVNGRNILSEHSTTLATEFKKHGYHTGAIIGAWVLNSNFGLNQGFDIYHDDFETLKNSSSNEVQRRADSVTDDALLWLSKTIDKPFFAWIHYFDPHDPYEPPDPFRHKHPDPYDGEIAFMDSQIQRVIDYLKSEDQLDRTLIVVVGDHGESFGEHGEHGHAVFLYQTNLHVPLIMSHPAFHSPQRIQSVVATVDIFPTLLAFMGWEAPENVLSRSLVTATVGEDLPAIAIYAENHHLFKSFGWAEQRSLITNRWKYISSTNPELYDLANDPAENRNLINEFPQLVKQMRETLSVMYDEMKPGVARSVTLNNEARRKLESLGYISGGSQTGSNEFLTPNLRDPKDMLNVYIAVHEGNKDLQSGETEKAIAIFQQAAKASPESISIQFILGFAYQQAGHHQEAIRTFQIATRIDPEYTAPLSMMAKSYESLGQLEEAVKHYRVSLAINDEDTTVYVSLAQLLRKMGKLDEALTTLRRSIEIKPDNCSALNELAILYKQQGNQTKAINVLERVLRIDPGYLTSVESLTNIHLKARRVKKAVRVLRNALPHAHNSLVVLKPYASLLATAPYDEVRDGILAIELAERSVAITHSNDPIVLATLAAAYAETGQFDKAITIATQAAELAKTKQLIPLSDFIINTHITSYRAEQPFRDISLLK